MQLASTTRKSWPAVTDKFKLFYFHANSHDLRQVLARLILRFCDLQQCLGPFCTSSIPYRNVLVSTGRLKWGWKIQVLPGAFAWQNEKFGAIIVNFLTFPSRLQWNPVNTTTVRPKYFGHIKLPRYGRSNGSRIECF
jgi:hypothetical protein